LINIHTGDVELGDESKKYVIGSYIWHPGILSLADHKQARALVDGPTDFETEVNNTCHAFPDYVGQFCDREEGYDDIRYPSRCARSLSLEYQIHASRL